MPSVKPPKPELYEPCHVAGGMTAYEWDRDPKRVGFILARYKVVAKLLAGKERVLEVGCADGYGSRVVRQAVGRLLAVDIDARSIEEARRNASINFPVEFAVQDIMRCPLPGFDAVYCLDVYEHIEDDETLLSNLRACAEVAVIGTPSLESQQYASELSRKGHVHCVNGEVLRVRCQRHWKQVFIFGMNDEVLHVGFMPMCQYLVALCVA